MSSSRAIRVTARWCVLAAVLSPIVPPDRCLVVHAAFHQIVMRSHDGHVELLRDETLTAHMEQALTRVASTVYATGHLFWIDKHPRTIPNHVHWHARGFALPSQSKL